MTGAPNRIAAQIRFEIAAVLRNGEQLLLTLVLPALLLAVLLRTDVVDPGGAPADRTPLVVAGILALAVLSTAFTSIAIATGFDRRAGVLRYLGTTPLGRSGLVAGKLGAVIGVVAVQTVILGGLAAALGWRPAPSLVLAIVPMVLGAACLAAWGLLLAGTLRAEAVLAVANLIWVLLLVGGGVVLVPEKLPGALAAVAPLLPSGALADSLRQVLTSGSLAIGPIAVLTAWLIAGVLAATRWFKWD